LAKRSSSGTLSGWYWSAASIVRVAFTSPLKCGRVTQLTTAITGWHAEGHVAFRLLYVLFSRGFPQATVYGISASHKASTHDPASSLETSGLRSCSMSCRGSGTPENSKQFGKALLRGVLATNKLNSVTTATGDEVREPKHISSR